MASTAGASARRTPWAWFGIALIATAPLAAQGGPQPAPAFRAGIDLITFEATALDAAGVPVRDLMPEDFSVMVGGRPRKVVFADFYGGGMVTPAPVAGSAETAREARRHVPTAEGRIVVIVVDRDSLAPGNEAALLETSTIILDSLQPADAVGLLGVPVGGVELTRDHDRVRKALPLMSGTRPRQDMYRDRNITWDEALGYERQDSRVIAEVVERECYNLPPTPSHRRTSVRAISPCRRASCCRPAVPMSRPRPRSSKVWPPSWPRCAAPSTSSSFLVACSLARIS